VQRIVPRPSKFRGAGPLCFAADGRALFATPDFPRARRGTERRRPHLPAARVPESHRQEPAVPIEHCYDVDRIDGDHDTMIREVMAFYRPDGFGRAPAESPATLLG